MTVIKTGSLLDHPGERRAPEPLLRVESLVKQFALPSNRPWSRSRGHIHAVSGVSFELDPGETLGLVGESGCGKSTTGRAVLQLHQPTSGSVRFQGRELVGLRGSALRHARRDMQMVFQDPYASLNPRWTVHDLVAEPLIVHGTHTTGTAMTRRVLELLDLVGLGSDLSRRYPHEFSGGQRQRVGIARALALNPRLLVLDEPVSALDVSVQAAVVNLLGELQERLGLAYLFIAHDLSVVRHISHRVAVMYLGKIVEVGPRQAIYSRPRHPYTEALLSAIPIADPGVERTRERIVLRGDTPSPAAPPTGCRFSTRCWKARDICGQVEPMLTTAAESVGGALVACHFPNT